MTIKHLRTMMAATGVLLVGCPAGDAKPNDNPTAVADTGDDDDVGVTSSPGDDADDDDGDGTTMAVAEESTGGPGGNSLDDGGGIPFIEMRDGGDPHAFACDLFAQDCMDGEKCMPWANDGSNVWNATRCVPLSPNPMQVGDACNVEGSGTTGLDNCDIGLMCWNVGEDGVGVCEDMCTGSQENPICENPDDACSIANDGAIVLCLLACDPLIQDCVVDNEVCYPVNDVWVCAPDASGMLGMHGDPCEFINACDEGNVCVGAVAFSNCQGSIGCCTSVCDLTDPSADAECAAFDPGQACEPWYAEGNTPPGYDDVGVCLVPQ